MKVNYVEALQLVVQAELAPSVNTVEVVGDG